MQNIQPFIVHCYTFFFHILKTFKHMQVEFHIYLSHIHIAYMYLQWGFLFLAKLFGALLALFALSSHKRILLFFEMYIYGILLLYFCLMCSVKWTTISFFVSLLVCVVCMWLTVNYSSRWFPVTIKLSIYVNIYICVWIACVTYIHRMKWTRKRS